MIFDIFSSKQKRAERFHQRGEELSEQGDDDGAIVAYQRAIALDPKRSESYYNIGLIYKYRNCWNESFAYNKKAYELAPEDEAARWNYAIAATALREWSTARKLWNECGIPLEMGNAPVDADFGHTPVRLNPDGDAEVVWAKRIDPVRAEIVSVPLPESGYATGDVVLHDGAPVGYRMLGEQEKPVFNVLELFSISPLSTYQLQVKVDTQADIDALLALLESQGLAVEDWTTNYRVLCKACSEGRPHEHHEHDAEYQWHPEHRVGIAATSPQPITEVIDGWLRTEGRRAIALECMLSRQRR